MITETVVLPGQSEQKVQTQVLDRDRESPVAEPVAVRPEPEPEKNEPAVASPEPEKNEPAAARPEPEANEPVEAPPVARNEPAPAESATGLWAVQLGSFSDQANAEKLAAELRKKGFLAVISKLTTDKGQLHRVRIGPQADRAAAEAVVKKLAAAGEKGQVVPHP